MTYTPDYKALSATITNLTGGETDRVALMATFTCEVHHADPRVIWTGFYRVVAPGLLKIGPYQGRHSCLDIPFGYGVCGIVAQTGQRHIVADVNAFPGHIVCASSTRSALVLPVHDGDGTLIGIFDIDSDQPAAFTETDADQLSVILQTVFAPTKRSD